VQRNALVLSLCESGFAYRKEVRRERCERFCEEKLLSQFSKGKPLEWLRVLPSAFALRKWLRQFSAGKPQGWMILIEKHFTLEVV